jgi:hypothetical protein
MVPKEQRIPYLSMGLPRVSWRYGDPRNFYQMGPWAPRHFEGNEAADRLANLEAHYPSLSTRKAAIPTLAGIESIARKLLHDTQQTW